MNLEKFWNFCVQSMSVLGNLVLLQVINILLIMTGVFSIAVPLIIVINSLMIYDYIYDNDNYVFTNLIGIIKKNFINIIAYVVISFILITAVGVNQNMQEIVISQNIGFWSEIILLVLFVIITFTLISFMVFFPLVNSSSSQDITTKLKVTFIVPFFSMKAFLLILLCTFINTIFFFSNVLFLIVFGPVLLLAVNIIIFNNYVINKEEN